MRWVPLRARDRTGTRLAPRRRAAGEPQGSRKERPQEGRGGTRRKGPAQRCAHGPAQGPAQGAQSPAEPRGEDTETPGERGGTKRPHPPVWGEGPSPGRLDRRLRFTHRIPRLRPGALPEP
ncbi:hypothetical protein STXM2123_1549 [Streptomyces sp. F-3]|nr:hypothetical protein STXM2123_1549 [Streptomyces sp. F-3]